MSPMYDCIIIGAGWSGAVAARSLASRGHRVLVLEARDRIGGRARTHTEGTHAPVDLGCSFIHGYNEGNPAREIARELGIDAHVMQPTNAAIFDSADSLAPEPAKALRASLSDALSSAASSASSDPPPSSTATLASSLFSSNSPLKTHAFARTLEVPYGIPLEDVSLKWHSWADPFGGSDAAVYGGFQALVGALFTQAASHGADVQLSAPVTSVTKASGGASVHTASGGAFDARAVLCTIPLGVLQHPDAQNLFSPELPARRQAVVQRTRVGVLEKLVLVYPKAWWPGAADTGSYTFLPASTDRADKAGSSAPEEAKRALEQHTISLASFAAPSLPTPHPTVVFYLSPGPALALAPFAAEDAARGAHLFLAARFGVDPQAAPQPTASTCTAWHADPYARGATSSPVVVGKHTSPLDFVDLGRPLWGGVLGFAGEHTDPENRGSIAGAIGSGRREAERVDLFLKRGQNGGEL